MKQGLLILGLAIAYLGYQVYRNPEYKIDIDLTKLTTITRETYPKAQRV